MTAEQRYHQAMLKARLIWRRQLAQYVRGDAPLVEALDTVEKRCLVEEMERAQRRIKLMSDNVVKIGGQAPFVNIRDVGNECPKCSSEDTLSVKYDAALDCIWVECFDCEYKFRAECADKVT